MNRANKKIAAALIGLTNLFGQASCSPKPLAAPVKYSSLNSSSIPFAARDKILIHHKEHPLYAVNFNYILRTGDARRGDTLYNDYWIDWQAHDAFIKTLQTIEDNCRVRVNAEALLQKLLKKPDWNLQEREQWEREICDIISEETSIIPAFQNYRHFDVHANLLNALSVDIDRQSEKSEFDCKEMSLIRGLLMQKIENVFLPKTADSHSFKQQLSYFAVSGGFSNLKGVGGAHAFVLTPTGNIVEATRCTTWNDYVLSANDNSLESFIRGGAIVADDGSDYGDYDLSTHAADRATSKKIKQGLLEGNRPHTRAELWRLQTNTCQVTENDRQDIICVASHQRENYQLKIYQKHDVGSPLESFVLVKEERKTGPLKDYFNLVVNYDDILREKTIVATANFTPSAIFPAIHEFAPVAEPAFALAQP